MTAKIAVVSTTVSSERYLAKKVAARISHQHLTVAFTRPLGGAMNDRHRSARALACHDLRRRGEFVGQRDDRRRQRPPERVGAAAIVDQRLQSGDAESDIDHAFPPRAT